MSDPSLGQPDHTTRVLRAIIWVLAAALALAAIWLALAYAFSPAAVRHPQATHYHFRLQVINDGEQVDFASAKFQEPEGTVCTVALATEPIHFHDHLDQFAHIHWDHMTGGLLLKNYGWNFITGPDNTLGYRFDQLPRVIRVPIHGQALPAPSKDARYFVYTGDADSYQARDWNDFLKQDLRDFFAGKKLSAGWWGGLVPTASAHGDDPRLTQLNDVLGSVVVFAQKNPPTPAQIKDRFNHLVPLPESTCGG